MKYGRNPDYSAMISGITEFLNSTELQECDDTDSAQKTYDTFFEFLLGPEIETWGQCYKTFYRCKLQIFIKARAFVPAKIFQPSLMFEGKAPFRCSTLGLAPGLPANIRPWGQCYKTFCVRNLRTFVVS